MITVSNYKETDEMGRFSVEVSLANNRDVQLAAGEALPKEKVRRTHLQGFVDTGAAMLVIPKWVADELGFPEVGSVKVRYADNRTGRRTRVSNVLLEVFGREAVFTAVVEPKRKTALIGAIVMEELDLVADCTTQTLHPRDPRWIVAEIE